jgi:hypothetical protein
MTRIIRSRRPVHRSPAAPICISISESAPAHGAIRAEYCIPDSVLTILVNPLPNPVMPRFKAKDFASPMTPHTE